MSRSVHARARALAREIADRCPAARSRALSRSIARTFDAELQDLGLQSSQLAVLAAVELLAPCRPMEVADALRLSRPAVTRSIAALERSDWVRTIDRDGRRHVVELTESGAELLVAAEAGWRRALARVGDIAASIPDPGTVPGRVR